MRDPVDRVQTEREEVSRLKRRADFLRVSQGQRWHGKSLTLQAVTRDYPAEDSAAKDSASATLAITGPRVGFTLTKKVGCAVIRNRARRRLKEAVRLSHDLPLRSDNDYVIVGRLDAIRLPFAALRDELARAVHAVESRGDARRDGGRKIKRPSAPRPVAERADLANTRPEP